MAGLFKLFSPRHRRPVASQPAPPPSTPTPPPVSAPQPALANPGIRLTDLSDGILLNRTYGYWATSWVNGDRAYCFVGHADEHPRFFRVDLRTREVQRLGTLHFPYTGTGEGWSYNATGGIYLHQGSRLRRMDPLTGEDRLIFDVGGRFPGCRLHQGHTSDDGYTHSATLEQMVDDGPYPKLGTIIWHHGQLDYYPAYGMLDESQLSRDGRYCLIKETRAGSEDNRIITVATGEARWILDMEGALGHSDMGPDYVVGEDNQSGVCVRIDLTTLSRKPLFQTWGMGTLSIRAGTCLRSDATELSLIPLDGSPVTWKISHGMVGDPSNYEYQVHASLDASGRVATFLSNSGTDRVDAYLVELPG